MKKKWGMATYMAAALLVAVIGLGGCTGTSDSGGSSGGSTDNEDDAEDVAEASLTMGNQASTVAGQAASLIVSGTLDETISADCPGGGSIAANVEASSSSLTFTDCQDSAGDEISGTLTFSMSGDTFTFTVSDLSATKADGSSATFDGTMTVTSTSISANLSGTVNEDSFTSEASITINNNNTIDGTMNVTVDDNEFTCTFDDFAVTTATDDDWDDACTVSS